MKFSAIRTIAAIVAGLTLGGPSFAQEPKEFLFGLPSKSMVASSARFADEMGLFAKHGLRPKFTYLENASSAIAAVVSNSVVFATSDMNSTVIATAKGQPIVVVANHYNGMAASLVLTKTAADKLKVKADAPAAERLKALDGLLLASTSAGSNLTVAYRSATAAVGATPRFTYMALAAMGAALDAGIVDGAIMTAPFWAFPVVKGNGVLWLSAPKGEIPAQYGPIIGSTTNAKRELAETNPELVRKVVAVFDDFTAAIVQRPAEVKAAMGRVFPEIDPKTLDLVFELESRSLNAKKPVPSDVVNDIALMKSAGIDVAGAEKLDPSVFLLKP